MMRAMLLNGHGGLDQLEYRTDVPAPLPGPGEVLIEVAACGMNNTDINTRLGWYSKTLTGETGAQTAAADIDGSWGGGLRFPRIQGADPAGRIVEVGDGVDAGLVGRRVLVDPWIRADLVEDYGYLGSEVDGGYAEYVVVPAANAHPVDTDLTDIELASFPCSYSAAEHMLHRAGVHHDQWVLVTGASGGVGGALVQLAKRRGARVLAVTSAAKGDMVRGFGADEVLDRSAFNLDGAGIDEAVLDLTGGVDVVADVVGGEMFPPLFEAIRRGGHYVTAGAIAGPIVSLDLRTLYLHDITMHGATVFPPEVFANLVGYIERNEIRPLVGATYPLKEMRAAQEAFMVKRHVGGIVIEIQ
jgi:NADPH:quinone reductase-like Zn-dependent oxidoreductase